MNIYQSIEPSKMTNSELKAICGDLQTAINWRLPYAKVKLNNFTVKVETSKLKEYQKAFKTECYGKNMS